MLYVLHDDYWSSVQNAVATSLILKKGKVTRVVNTLLLSQSDKIRDFVLPDAGTLLALTSDYTDPPSLHD